MLKSVVKSWAPEPVRRAVRESRERLHRASDRARLRSGFRQPDEALEREAHAFWNGRDDAWLRQMAHWRGAGVFEDDQRWLTMGRFHLDLYRRLAGPGAAEAGALERIVEWGCGGGANAVAFGPLARSYVGVDVSPATLEECARQMALSGHRGFEPALIDTSRPEDALRVADPGTCDLFLCTYVMEVMPSPEYGMKMLEIGHRMLRPGGRAFVHFKYDRGDWQTAAKRWDYVRHFPANTTYRVEMFWDAAARLGLVPEVLHLVPYQPFNDGTDNAYVLMRRDD